MNNNTKKDFDNEKIKEIIRLSCKKFKQRENKGTTRAQIISEIVEGIERVLKDGN